MGKGKGVPNGRVGGLCGRVGGREGVDRWVGEGRGVQVSTVGWWPKNDPCENSDQTGQQQTRGRSSVEEF